MKTIYTSSAAAIFAVCVFFTGICSAGILNPAEFTEDKLGPFGAPPSFRGEYRMGWSGIEAARATATVESSAGTVKLSGSGGTTGLARALWSLDAWLDAEADRTTLHTLWSEQTERYAKRSLVIKIAGSGGELTSLREWIPDPAHPSPKWQVVKVKPVRDFFAGMLFIRSRPLQTGEVVRLAIFPGGSPFYIEAESRGVEKKTISGVEYEALRLDLNIQAIDTSKGNALVPHSKFRSGTVWLTNDADRLPLRAEVDIFIGYVFGEMISQERL